MNILYISIAFSVACLCVCLCCCCHIRHSQRPLIFYIWNAVKKKPRKLQEKKLYKKKEREAKKRTGVLCRVSLCCCRCSLTNVLSVTKRSSATCVIAVKHSQTNTLTYIERHTRAPLHLRILSYICACMCARYTDTKAQQTHTYIHTDAAAAEAEGIKSNLQTRSKFCRLSRSLSLGVCPCQCCKVSFSSSNLAFNKVH